ncbi:hypothetical protein L2E82_11054 [Cichorium intybus]|uniref:Uncharacterized protein n=1 Tax=Cichorium intybus TaxID=13427 RepID=A0ACB9GDD8_CICIN|nr:hypothetical protein L2E82_11054 [Cichorium intybus]
MVGDVGPAEWPTPKVPPRSTQAGPPSSPPGPPIDGWPLAPPDVALSGLRALALALALASCVSCQAGHTRAEVPKEARSGPDVLPRALQLNEPHPLQSACCSARWRQSGQGSCHGGSKNTIGTGQAGNEIPPG